MGHMFLNQSEKTAISSSLLHLVDLQAHCYRLQTPTQFVFTLRRLWMIQSEMESLSKVDEPFPTPPPYFLPDEIQSGQDVRVYHVHSPFTPPPPPSFSFSPGVGCSTQNNTPVQVSTLPLATPRPKFVSYETQLYRSPSLTTCPSCQTQVTTQVTYKVGTYAWIMCLLFALCGLLLGCCLIPFFVNHFKDAYHTCPRCRRVLHVHKKRCCE